MIGFIPRERVAQTAYFNRRLPADVAGHGGSVTACCRSIRH